MDYDTTLEFIFKILCYVKNANPAAAAPVAADAPRDKSHNFPTPEMHSPEQIYYMHTPFVKQRNRRPKSYFIPNKKLQVASRTAVYFFDATISTRWAAA